jgi:glycosyltransferase 2 family protein
MGMARVRRPSASHHRARLLRIVGLVVSVVALAVVVRSMDVAAAARIIARADGPILLLVLVVLAVQLSLRALRWQVLLPHRDGRRIPLRRVIPPLLVGYLGNAVLPARLGEPIRAALIARRERLDTLECFGTTITERVIDTATLAIVGFIAALVVDAPGWILVLAGAAAAIGAAVIVLLVTVGLTAIAEAVGRIVSRTPIASRGEAVVRWGIAFAQGVDRGRVPRRLVAVVAISCVCWGIDATVFWSVAQAIGVSMTFPVAVLVAAVTVLGTAVPSAPG